MPASAHTPIKTLLAADQAAEDTGFDKGVKDAAKADSVLSLLEVHLSLKS
jgi:hypothetical protein